MSTPIAFTYDATPGRVVFGLDALDRVADETAALGAAHVFIVASNSARTAAARVTTALGASHARTWTEVTQHVPADLATRATDAARTSGADAIVAIGGGSATGLAKAIALELAIPIVAVPTTYAGSEMTTIFGITGEHKQTGRDPRVLPRVSIYDPVLTISLPAGMTATSAGNALAHCVEALWAPDASPVPTLLATEAIRVIAHALPDVAARPTDVDARTRLLLGAYLASGAFSATMMGLHHRLCHVLGGTYGLDHSAAHAVLLPYVVAFEAAAAPDAVAAIARALDSGDAANALRDLLVDVGAPASLADLGLPPDALDDAAARVVAEAPPSPRPLDVATVHTLLADAHAGHRPSAAH
ncbi:MAG TPA: maleylacetate reductase [Acidimicrobiia bacterium]